MPVWEQGRNWVFTVNNPVRHVEFDQESMVYLLFGHEIAPTMRTPHLQGYVQFRTRRTLEQVHTNSGIGQSLYCAIAVAEVQVAADYCKND